MNLYDTLLQQTICHFNHFKPQHSQIQNDSCTPWQNDSRQTPYSNSYDYSNNNQQSKRYNSQLRSYKRKSQDRNNTSLRRHSILTQKSVSIEYESTKTDPAQSHINKINLPVLTSKHIHTNRLLGINRENNTQKWQCLRENNRKSLKKYSQKTTNQQSQQFQLYKRNVIAARKFILNSLLSPKGTLEKYGNM